MARGRSRGDRGRLTIRRVSAEPPQILTVGHSTHDEDRFLDILRGHGVELLADVRRFPASRRNPQFGAEHLAEALKGMGLAYAPFGEELGGRRRPSPASPNGGWRVDGFRAYADHMSSDEFEAGLRRLADAARERRTAVMCAEGDWRRCHRRLIADALLVQGWRVIHVLRDGGREDHELTPFAVVDRGRLTYPPAQAELT